MTALHWAAHWNDSTTVKALIAAGARAERANRYGVTPLHEAATIGSAPIVNALLRAGADVDATYGEGETPLMLAARSGNIESVKLLVEAGPRECGGEIPRTDGADAGGGREPRLDRSGTHRRPAHKSTRGPRIRRSRT